jgi:pilus assembly protein CpaF
MARNFLFMAAELADIVVVDCSAPNQDALSYTAITVANTVVTLVEPTIRGVSFWGAMRDYAEAADQRNQHFILACPCDQRSSIDFVSDAIGRYFSAKIPFSPEVSFKYQRGRLFSRYKQTMARPWKGWPMPSLRGVSELNRAKYTLSDGNVRSYAGLVETIQQDVSSRYAKEYAAALAKGTGESFQKALIHDFIVAHDVLCSQKIPMNALIDEIYEDMSGESIIKKYREMPEFQEFNLNSWDDCRVNINGIYRPIPETFLSPQHAIDVIRRLLTACQITFDDAYPMAIGALDDSTRIAVQMSPVVDANIAISGSIRSISGQVMNMEFDAATEFANAEILESLITLHQYGACMCMGGRTGSGKSTLEGWLLSQMKGRLITIEDGSRQLGAVKQYDKDGKPVNDVVNLYTRKSENANQNYDMNRLLEQSLKLHPDFICVDEMVSGEANTAQAAARTGHMVMTSIHTTKAKEAWDRMASMAQEVSAFDYNSLMRLMVMAFPIVVYMHQSKIDHVHRIITVLEGERYTASNGLETRVLYQFYNDGVKTVNGKKRVVGHYEHPNGISEELQQLLRDNEAPMELIQKLARKEEAA